MFFGYPLSVVPLDQSRREPVQSLVQAITRSSTASLDVPLAVRWTESVQSQLVCHFCRGHRVGQILFVGKDEEYGIAEFIFVQHSVQFVARRVNAIRIIGIDDKDETLRVLVVVAPQRTDFILTADVPNCKGDVLVFNGFHVKANRRNCRDDY